MLGPQTYRRAQVHLSGPVHVFNILFQPTGLNRLIGINTMSLVNQDPAASDILNKADSGASRRLSARAERKCSTRHPHEVSFFDTDQRNTGHRLKA